MIRFATVAVFVLLGALPAMAASAPASGMPAPSTDRANEATVQRRDVTIGEGRQQLAGTLYQPADLQGSSAPAVVVISGSGPNDREGHIGAFRAYGLIAEHLSRAGVPTLLIDRRGVGGSAGNWRRETIPDRARDAVAALRWLREQPGVDPARVGLLGHSQGGWVVTQAAADSRDVAFIVLMAGPGETVREQILTDARKEMLASGTAPDEVERRVRRLARLIAIAHFGAPVCRLLRLHTVCSTVDYDPGAALARVDVPVLALFAELDPMVPPDSNIPRIREGLARAGNEQLTVHVFQGVNHQFWPAVTGARSEYRRLDKRYAPGFLDTISTWILGIGAGPARPVAGHRRPL